MKILAAKGRRLEEIETRTIDWLAGWFDRFGGETATRRLRGSQNRPAEAMDPSRASSDASLTPGLVDARRRAFPRRPSTMDVEDIAAAVSALTMAANLEEYSDEEREDGDFDHAAVPFHAVRPGAVCFVCAAVRASAKALARQLRI